MKILNILNHRQFSGFQKLQVLQSINNLKNALKNASQDDISRLAKDLRSPGDLSTIRRLIESAPFSEESDWEVIHDDDNARNRILGDRSDNEISRIYDRLQTPINEQSLIVLKTLQGSSRNQAETSVKKVSSFSLGDDTDPIMDAIISAQLKELVKEESKKYQKQQEQEKSDCFVATATYGTPHAKEVIKYRSFRDKHLRKLLVGRLLINIYKVFGPFLAGATSI